jgi:hypothetical protein
MKDDLPRMVFFWNSAQVHDLGMSVHALALISPVLFKRQCFGLLLQLPVQPRKTQSTQP